MILKGNEQVFYSICSGYNYYVKTNQTFVPSWDRVAGEKENRDHEVIKHVQSDEEYYITQVPPLVSKRMNVNEWVNFIRNQPKSSNYIWPIDIIVRGYDKNDTALHSLVFPKRTLANLKINNLIDYLDSDEYKKLPDNKRDVLIKSFLDAWNNFFSLGYAYHEYNRNSLFINVDNYEVFSDFSFSLQHISGLNDKKEFLSINLLPEYNDPYFYYRHGNQKNITNAFVSELDLASDYFCLAVFLFKMIVGILPYEGRHVSSFPKHTKEDIQQWQQAYIEYPIFIFDEKDEENRLTLAVINDQYRKRWESLPQHLRNMFHNVFQQANALRSADKLFFYSPSEWKFALSGIKADEVLVYREYY